MVDHEHTGVAYTASKHALIGLTKNTAAFYRLKGIRCNAIQCGAMRTNIGQTAMANGYCEEGLALSMKHCTFLLCFQSHTVKKEKTDCDV